MESGQRLNITLVDFSSGILRLGSGGGGGGGGVDAPEADDSPSARGGSHQGCRRFLGRLFEPAFKRSVDVCALPNVRESHVQISQTSVVHVTLNRNTEHQFLMIFSGEDTVGEASHFDAQARLHITA